MESKKLIFGPPYPYILFTGEKVKTFRVTGGDRYQIGDSLSFCYPDMEIFGQARLVDKIRRTFETLTPEDWIGHERFNSEQEMYQTYSNWQGFQVGPKTGLDILVYDNFVLTGKPRIKLSQPKCTTIPEISNSIVEEVIKTIKPDSAQNQSKCITNPQIIKKWFL